MEEWNGIINEQPQDYHMNVYIFGGTSSPSCSNYTLQRTARDHEARHGKEEDTFRKKIYKYDLLEQVQDEQTAVKLMKDVRAMCAEGSFHLTEFVSNIKDSLLSIPEEERRVFKIRN